VERPKQAVLVIDTGQALSRSDAEARARTIDHEIADWKKIAKENEGRMRWAYRVRNVSVVAGLGVLALWRTLNLA
jgi:hypothetical protein